MSNQFKFEQFVFNGLNRWYVGKYINESGQIKVTVERGRRTYKSKIFADQEEFSS